MNELLVFLDSHPSILTFVFIVVTAVYVVITNKILHIQSDPNVVVYPEIDKSRPSIILLIVENIGNTPAEDIILTFPKGFPLRSFGFEKQNNPKPEKNIDIPIEIPYLAPRSKIQMIWGQRGGLSENGCDKPQIVEIDYKSIYGGTYYSYSKLTIQPYNDLNADIVDPDGARQSAEQLKRIADAICTKNFLEEKKHE